MFYNKIIFFLLSMMSVMGSLSSHSVFDSPAYKEFCRLTVEDDSVFADFRRHPRYQGVLEPVSFNQGMSYLNTIKEEYPEILNNLSQFCENGAMGNPIVYQYESYGAFSPTTLRYIKIAGDLKARFGDLSQMHVVEIGGGYGGQCKVLAELTGFGSYTIINRPENNRLAKKYLDTQGIQKLTFIDYDQLSHLKYCDLLICDEVFFHVNEGEQIEYMEKVLKHAKNGYMICNLASNRKTKARYLSIEEIILFLCQENKKGKVENELPWARPYRQLVTWKHQKATSNALRNRPTLEPSPVLQTQNAVTYSFSGGRLGDNLLAYLHAKWIAYKYDLPLLDQIFPGSKQFQFEMKGQKVGSSFLFNQDVFVSHLDLIDKNPSSSIFTIPYFPDTKCEHQMIKMPCLPYFKVDWEDPQFRAEVRDDLKPIDPIQIPDVPKDCLTVAVHVRRGGGIDYEGSGMTWPLKFPPDEYYIQQINRIAKIYQNQRILVHIFTDDLHPQRIVESFRKTINNPFIEFSCRKKDNSPTSNILQDFYYMTKFNCLICGQSNFSHVASLLGNHTIVIIPTSGYVKNKKIHIDQVELIFQKVS
jgi:2-polyprenyl-3-methyl-5-hydroxy-6-metoxy-1,4-benzoquinol methylase